jgi:hypothetical protein
MSDILMDFLSRLSASGNLSCDPRGARPSVDDVAPKKLVKTREDEDLAMQIASANSSNTKRT